MSEFIANCYDSHVHLLATGQVEEGLKLHGLTCAEDAQHIVVRPEHFRSHWLTGFGWNQNNWLGKQFPDRKLLDISFSGFPVFFSRVDGHASWINSTAIKELSAKGMDFSKDPVGGKIERDSSGNPTGVLFDQAHIQALMLLPDFTSEQNLKFLKTAQAKFNRAGFTHIRDMSMSLQIWRILRQLEIESNLSLAVEGFITIESVADIENTFEIIDSIKKENSLKIRICGLKIFVDGSLGSKTAFLSKPYLNSTEQGLLTWKIEDIETVIQNAWQKNLDVAVHCIGDQSAHVAVQSARKVAAQGLLGRIHLEHVQLLRNETIQMMKPLHVTCHMQPCHWLSDHLWLKNALSPDLMKTLFQWEALRKNKIQMFFGSDSPIEEPSLFNNQKALESSCENGIPKLNFDWKFFHSHPDKDWCPSVTQIDDERIVGVKFCGNYLKFS